jgi:hypothetical protein
VGDILETNEKVWAVTVLTKILERSDTVSGREVLAHWSCVEE